MLNTPITPPRVALIDPRTNQIDRAWYMFFLSLNNAVVATENVDVGPNAEVLLAAYDAALRSLAQEVGAQPVATDLTAELTKHIEAAGIADQCSSLISQVAEIQKQIDALNSAPAPSQGTITAVTATAPVVSSGGTAPDISLASGYGDTQNPYAVKTANYVLAGPTTGADAFPTFRALVAADIPALSYGSVSSVALSAPTGFAVSGSPITTSGTLALSFTAGYSLPSDATQATWTAKQSVSAPVTYTANFSVATTDLWIINNKSGSSCTATLPAAASYAGRVLHFQNYQVQTLVSASSNVVPLAGGAAGTSILLASSGDSATLVSDGSNWLMTQYVPNNILLLE